jgi:hypothetical protein
MKGLEAGLYVRDIAVFGLSTCGPGERIGAVRARVDRFDFDNVPVKSRDVIGVVENIKCKPRDAHVRDVMAPLAESMLIAGALSLVRVPARS